MKDVLSREIIELLTFLLPGLVATQVYGSLTAMPKPVPFDRVVQSLMFTIGVQWLVVMMRVMVLALGNRFGTIGVWDSDRAFLWSVAFAVLSGVMAAWGSNTDTIHAILRKLRVSHQTSFPSEWFGAFALKPGYVVLHLSGERRLYGWADEWPSTPETGHFVMSQAEWLTDDSSIPLSGVQRIVIRAPDVLMVEMMGVRAPTAKEMTNG